MNGHWRNFWLRPAGIAIFAGLAGLALVVVGLYANTLRHLDAARQARRGDDYSATEQQLAACWPLPGLGKAIELERALSGVQQGDITSEAAWQARATPPSSQSLLILEALAKGNAATFRWNETRTYAQAILERQPDNVQALWLRGQAWSKVQQEERALADLVQAIERDPQSFEIRRTLAELLLQQGFVRRALDDFVLLEAQRPTDPRIQLGLARCYEEEGQPTVARTLLDRLLGVEPRLIAALVERARVALRLGQAAEAEPFLQRALEICPSHTDANFVLQLCLQAQGRNDESLEQRIRENEQRQAELRVKLRDQPHDPATLYEVGQRMAELDQQEEAVAWYFLALREPANYAPAHAALADYFQRSGQPRQALTHRTLAGDANPLLPVSKQVTPFKDVLVQVAARQPKLTLPDAEATSEQVHALCAACHAYPPPESMPRAAWRKEVKQGFNFLRDSALSGEFPPLESVVRYFESRAPKQLPRASLTSATSKPPVRFERAGTGWLANVPPFPGVANIELTRLLDEQKLDLLACDTRIDRVMSLRPYEKSPTWQLVAQVPVPSHATVADLDGDGRRDVLVASLGEFFPTDDKVGSVVWLRQSTEGRFEPVTLLAGVGRVADVEAADFNGDGRLDLVVAVFGWRKTGEIMYLENHTTDWSQPIFIPSRVDPRHGAIHVPVVDLDRDGRPDFVALISQEHETVVAYINQGNGQFRQETLFTAPHPSFGTSGIQVIDLDGDGDHDVLLTNGDVLDRPYLLKPYHGVSWLENEGSFPFTHHPLAQFCGASRAVAADFDGDQDLDVVAVSFLPRLEFPERHALRLPAVILLEQTSRGAFVPHVLVTGSCDHFSCAAGDWDGDGRPDLAIGNFSWKRSEPLTDAAVLWKNSGPENAPR